MNQFVTNRLEKLVEEKENNKIGGKWEKTCSKRILYMKDSSWKANKKRKGIVERSLLETVFFWRWLFSLLGKREKKMENNMIQSWETIRTSNEQILQSSPNELSLFSLIRNTTNPCKHWNEQIDRSFVCWFLFFFGWSLFGLLM